MAIFIGIETIAVWPALLPSTSGLASEPAILAAIGLLAATTVYVVVGGNSVDMPDWRKTRAHVTEKDLPALYQGLFLLTAGLVALGLYTFGGLPPLLSGGLTSLIDPVGHAEQVALIRESRRELTKGHLLLGESYAGQGIVNAFTAVGWQAVVSMAVFLLVRGQNTRRWILVAVLVLAFIFLGSTGSRSPVLLALVMGVATFSYAVKVSGKTATLIAAISMGVILIVMPLAKGSEVGGATPVERVAALMERVTDGNGRNNAKIVELVDWGRVPVERGGLFVERLQAMVPGVGEEDPFALRITRLAYGGGSNVTGYSTPTQYGLLYADWGAVGVIFGYAASGLLIGLLWPRLLRWRIAIGPVVAGLAAVQLGYLSVTGVHGLITNAAIATIMVGILWLPKVLSDRWSPNKGAGRDLEILSSESSSKDRLSLNR
jgi:hypothetical protein